MSKSAKTTPKERWKDDSVLSKNNSKSVRFRIRVQQEKEAEEEIENFKQDTSGTMRVPDPLGEHD